MYHNYYYDKLSEENKKKINLTNNIDIKILKVPSTNTLYIEGLLIGHNFKRKKNIL
jgi:hypothetical protein